MVKLDTGHRGEGFQVEQAAGFPDRLRRTGRSKWIWLRRELALLLPDQGGLRLLCPTKEQKEKATQAIHYWAKIGNLPDGCRVITASEPASDGAYHLYIALETVEEE